MTSSTPGHVKPDGTWQTQAACGGPGAEEFFSASTVAAKKICRGCPVQAECLYDALEGGAPIGVWGGLTSQERRKLPALPRPRAAAIAALAEVLAAYNAASHPEPEKRVPVRPRRARTNGKAGKPRRRAAVKAEPRDDVAEMLRQGATYRQIKTELGASAEVVAATRRAYEIPVPPGNGGRRSPEQRAANEKRTIELLSQGATHQQVTDEVGISAPTIIAIRRKAGLPPPGRRGGLPARTKAEALAHGAEPYGDGHARWTGPMAGRMPQLNAEGGQHNARRVAFEQHHGRPPIGYVHSNCGEAACITGAHLDDDQLRTAQPEEPVTVQALTDLLDDIDQEGGPQAALDNRLHLRSERTTQMATTPNTSTLPATSSIAIGAAEGLPVGNLLKWGAEHIDPGVKDLAARADVALRGLRQRYAADQELTAITTEAEQLEKRLAELRAREQELVPPKAKPKKKQQLDYDSPTVRAWARTSGVDCPTTGRIPKAVVDQWKTATGQPTGGPS